MARTICRSEKIGESTFSILYKGAEIQVDVSHKNGIYETYNFVNSDKEKVTRFMSSKILKNELRKNS